ncbi:MAG: DUF2059 domain-containing protein [Caulobacteraceae bacterium]|nr:DUF2059 domain-containing protein [Caulobacteraceae bacterium]
MVLVAAPLNAMAQEPAVTSAATDSEDAERLALANRFIVLMQTDQMAAMFSQMMGAMSANIPGMTAERSAGLQRTNERIFSQMMPRIFEIQAPIYADIFTLDELQGMVAFYESDIGKSMIRKSYEAGPRMTAALMAIMPELMGDVADALCDETGCPDEIRASMTESFSRTQSPSAPE